MSKIDEFVSIIVVNLREELDSGSTIVVDDELLYQTLIVLVIWLVESWPSMILVVEFFSTINEFVWTEIDATLVVEECWVLRHLVNEEPIDRTIEVSVTGTMVSATLSVEEMGRLRLLESEVDVIYTCRIEMIWRKGSLLNDDKRTNKEIYPSTVLLLFCSKTILV